MLLELIDIHKQYGAVKANDGVDVVFKPGEIHGILGENGAGKSTLMKILAGYTSATSGELRANGKKTVLKTPTDAAALGIGMLYQDPLDFPVLSVKENFLLGQKKGAKKNQARLLDQFSAMCHHLGFNLPLQTPVNRLTVGERQQLEIVRLISMGTTTLILDEPTTGISEIQKQTLFSALAALTQEGKTVILVSHKLEDVLALCHRVTVLRAGKKTGEAARPLDTRKLLEMMFGAPPANWGRRAGQTGDIVLAMDKVSGAGGRSGLSSCSLSIRSGEITALAGLEGSGQGVFMRLAAGLARPSAGRIHIHGRDMTGGDHLAFKSRKVAWLPGSRLEEGLMGALSVTEHCCLNMADAGFVIPRKKAETLARDCIDHFRIAGTPDSSAQSLSGGNQQRLLLSFLPRDPALLLLENPTRGLDVESANWVWTLLSQYSDKGAAVVFSSTELDEIFMAADRIFVFFDGKMVLDVPTAQTDMLTVGAAIAGET